MAPTISPKTLVLLLGLVITRECVDNHFNQIEQQQFEQKLNDAEKQLQEVQTKLEYQKRANSNLANEVQLLEKRLITPPKPIEPPRQYTAHYAGLKDGFDCFETSGWGNPTRNGYMWIIYKDGHEYNRLCCTKADCTGAKLNSATRNAIQHAWSNR